MAIPHINPDDGYRAGLQNDHFYSNFYMADHPRKFLVQSYGSFRDQQG
jgi:hypothetical protein